MATQPTPHPFLTGWNKLPDELKLQVLYHAIPRDQYITQSLFTRGPLAGPEYVPLSQILPFLAAPQSPIWPWNSSTAATHRRAAQALAPARALSHVRERLVGRCQRKAAVYAELQTLGSRIPQHTTCRLANHRQRKCLAQAAPAREIPQSAGIHAGRAFHGAETLY